MKRTVTITLRLTAEEEKVLDRVASELRASRSEALRAVLRDRGAKLVREETMTAHDFLKHYIPKQRGPLRKRSLAENVSEEFHKIVLEKHRGRRPS
jgi:hypothetical protein